MTSAKLGACAEPVLGPAVPPAAAPREPMEAMPVNTRAAPAMPTVARVTPVELVDLPLLICEVRQETVLLSAPMSWSVAEPSNYIIRRKDFHSVYVRNRERYGRDLAGILIRDRDISRGMERSCWNGT